MIQVKIPFCLYLLISVFKKKDGTVFEYPKPKKPEAAQLVSKQQQEMVAPFLMPASFHFFSWHNIVHVLPKAVERELQILQSALYIKKAGVAVGTCSNTGLIPAHDLAVSTIVHPQLHSYSLTLPEALRYLRKQDLVLPNAPKGWCLLQYESYNLGWAKVLPNRLNNYYPKEWRIRTGG